MRFLLAVLVLANVALYLLWGPYRLEMPSSEIARGSQGGGGLKLITEVNARQLERIEPRSTAPSKPPRPAPETTAAIDDGAMTGAVKSVDPAPTDTPAPDAAPRPSRVAICYTLGTLIDRLHAERLVGDLTAAGLDSEVRSESRRGDLSGYWVILPPRPSLAQAQSTIAELQGRGVDSFVISTGDYRHGVSLGFFHNRESAEALERRMRAQGYNPRVVITHRRETVYWVDLDETVSREFKDAQWRALADEYPQLGRYVRDCG